MTFPLTVVATMRARPGMESELHAVLSGLIGPTRSDAGLIDYELYRETQDPFQFCFIERWEGEDALERHLGQPHVVAFISRAHELVDGDVVVNRLRLVDRA